MAKKIFTDKQQEIVARKLGYQGPMSEFEKFVQSDPAMQHKLNLLTSKFMARGGVVRKYVEGGVASQNLRNNNVPAFPGVVGSGLVSNTVGPGFGQPVEPLENFAPGLRRGSQFENTVGVPGYDGVPVGTGMDTKTTATPTDAPARPTLASPKVATVPTDEKQDVKFDDAKTKTATGEKTSKTEKVKEPTKPVFKPIEAAKTKADVDAITAANKAIVGTVSDKAQAVAAEMTPTETALMNMEAARLENPREVVGAPIRELQAEELVSGPAVNMANVEATLNKAVAATAAVTPEMTVQGQLDKLLTDFDAGNPPSWAASSLRNANSVLAARGLGASSLAGQAVIQATLEAAVPLAAQDAQTTAALEMQNLSNRQQTAVLVAQQRAAFLGQEFDQAFQARVTNAARVADVANQNFSAGVQIAMENARLAQTVDLANLSNEQAIVMAQAAQIANIETTNLNNRQQAAVQNAQAFLQMDLTNVNNAQQTAMMNAQARIQAAFTDAAAENATRQFNASSGMQVDQFYSSLSAQVGQFNASQTNAMEQFNVSQANALAQFNASQTNAMEQFNSQNRLIVDQSNAEWRRNIATIDTATQNNANMFDAQAGLQVTMAEYNNQWQTMRDTMEYAFKASENFLDRQNTLAIAVLQKDAAIAAAERQAKGAMYKSLGALATNVLASTDIASDLYKAGKSFLSELGKSGVDIADFGTGSISADIIADLGLKEGDLYGDLGDIDYLGDADIQGDFDFYGLPINDYTPADIGDAYWGGSD